MAKVFYKGKGKIPKRIGDLVLYPLEGEMIIREKSGFTTEGLKKDPKYALCRKNASEFGRVSLLSKSMRLGLMGILPKGNHLAVRNSLAKQLHCIMAFDSDSARGARVLWKAFLDAKARGLMRGYSFNPDAFLPATILDALHLDASGNLKLSGLSITDELSFPDGSDCIGIRLHHLDFDFTDGDSLLDSSAPLFLRGGSAIENFQIANPYPAEPKGVLFSILEVQFYVSDDGGFVPLVDDSTKIVHVLGVA